MNEGSRPCGHMVPWPSRYRRRLPRLAHHGFGEARRTGPLRHVLGGAPRRQLLRGRVGGVGLASGTAQLAPQAGIRARAVVEPRRDRAARAEQRAAAARGRGDRNCLLGILLRPLAQRSQLATIVRRRSTWKADVAPADASTITTLLVVERLLRGRITPLPGKCCPRRWWRASPPAGRRLRPGRRAHAAAAKADRDAVVPSHSHAAPQLAAWTRAAATARPRRRSGRHDRSPRRKRPESSSWLLARLPPAARRGRWAFSRRARLKSRERCRGVVALRQPARDRAPPARSGALLGPEQRHPGVKPAPRRRDAAARRDPAHRRGNAAAAESAATATRSTASHCRAHRGSGERRGAARHPPHGVSGREPPAAAEPFRGDEVEAARVVSVHAIEAGRNALEVGRT